MIINYIHYIVWDESTYPFSNLNGATAEVWQCIHNFTPHFTGHGITHPWWLVLKLINVNKRDPTSVIHETYCGGYVQITPVFHLRCHKLLYDLTYFLGCPILFKFYPTLLKDFRQVSCVSATAAWVCSSNNDHHGDIYLSSVLLTQWDLNSTKRPMFCRHHFEIYIMNATDFILIWIHRKFVPKAPIDDESVFPIIATRGTCPTWHIHLDAFKTRGPEQK